MNHSPQTTHRRGSGGATRCRDRGGPNCWALRPKKGAFNRGGRQAPIEFRGKTTRDVAVQHCIDILRARLTTTLDRRGQSKAAKRSKKTNLSCVYVTLPTANAPSLHEFVAQIRHGDVLNLATRRASRHPHRSALKAISAKVDGHLWVILAAHPIPGGYIGRIARCVRSSAAWTADDQNVALTPV